MTDELSAQSLWRSAFPPPAHQLPSRDLWPLLVHRISAPVQWSWFDIGVAAVVVIALFKFPEWLVVLAFHL